MELQERIKLLERKLLDAKKKYYGLDEENDFDEIQLLDAEYDQLEEELRKIDPNNPVLSKVGSDFIKGIKVVHDIPMKSMDKIHTKNELEKWFDEKLSILINENMEIVIEPKVDGCSGELRYENGKLVEASTRGNGNIGYKVDVEDYQFVPKTINLKGSIKVRGEFHLPKSYNNRFDIYNQKQLRNVASGIVNRKEKSEDQKEMRFIAYQLLGTDISKESDKLKKLEELSFYTVPRVILRSSKEIWDYFEKYVSNIRDVWEFETDGICLIINDDLSKKKVFEELGTTDHHEKWAIAIKPPAQGAWSVLRSVEADTSKDGKVTPVGIIAKVKIGDRFFERATLNNKSYIKLFDIKLNDKVYVISANDIIPHILHSQHTPQSTDIVIKNCPSCGAKLIEEGVNWYCPNVTGCPAQKINKFLHWFRKTGIKHVGESGVDSLINNGNVSNLWELYAMSNEDLMIFIEKFVGIDRNSVTMKEFKDLFEKSRHLSEQEIIAYYGIPNFGPKTVLEKNIKSLSDLELIAFRREDKREESLAEWLYKDNNLLNLRALVDKMDPSPISNLQADSGDQKYYCLTGKFEGGKKNFIQKLENVLIGWKNTDTFNINTKLLISGINEGNTNKIIKAKSLNVKILDVDDGKWETFEKLITDITI